LHCLQLRDRFAELRAITSVRNRHPEQLVSRARNLRCPYDRSDRTQHAALNGPTPCHHLGRATPINIRSERAVYVGVPDCCLREHPQGYSSIDFHERILRDPRQRDCLLIAVVTAARRWRYQDHGTARRRDSGLRQQRPRNDSLTERDWQKMATCGL
jgi:hypothetical protein